MTVASGWLESSLPAVLEARSCPDGGGRGAAPGRPQANSARGVRRPERFRLLAFSSRKPPQVLQNSLTPLSFPLAFIKKKIPAYI